MVKIKCSIGILAFLAVFLLLSNCQRLELVTVTKSTVNNAIYLNRNSVKIDLNISELSGSEHEDCGICYSKNSSAPTIKDNYISLGKINNTKVVTAIIENLNSDTNYYFRGYVLDNNEPVYSLNVVMNSEMPDITTINAYAINASSANLVGYINNIETKIIVGFEYGLTDDYGQKITAVQSPVELISSIEVFTRVKNLIPDTTYHYRIVVTNNSGTIHGDDITFKTQSLEEGTVKDFDGNVYNTIKIGNQVWLQENLKSISFNDGTPINYFGNNQILWETDTTGAYTFYMDNKDQYKDPLGGLYNWYVIDKSRNGGKNICPPGWHVPSDEEWTNLMDIADGVGENLREVNSEYWPEVFDQSNNRSGFSALGSGYYSSEGFYDGIKRICIWWTSTDYQYNNAGVWQIFYDQYETYSTKSPKNNGYSIRCIKD
ncbi:MAG: fibrobacter succinogenes major paralogous domain-containing protein [Bacteroidales bacterium]